MSHVPHELSEEFPDSAEALHRLKSTDGHFAQLAERYHEVNRAIHRAETDVEPMADSAITELRKERLALKDEIAAKLSTAA